jgi:hypothetical protein
MIAATSIRVPISSPSPPAVPEKALDLGGKIAQPLAVVL